jgi:crotonobetaine/carnitine-CoA ligase
MFSGYYGDDEATVEAWRNLWFHSGDRGYVDEDGYLWFADRKKEAIRKSGEMLSPAEVERTILEHDAVAECAVVGVPSELGDDDVKAVLVLAGEASVTPEEIVRFCEGKIAYFMVPRYIEIKDRLPKTPSERIEKYKLKEEGVTEGCWDRVAAGYQLAR